MRPVLRLTRSSQPCSIIIYSQCRSVGVDGFVVFSRLNSAAETHFRTLNFEQIELQAKLLNYFLYLGSNKSNINQIWSPYWVKTWVFWGSNLAEFDPSYTAHRLWHRGEIREPSCGKPMGLAQSTFEASGFRTYTRCSVHDITHEGNSVLSSRIGWKSVVMSKLLSHTSRTSTPSFYSLSASQQISLRSQHRCFRLDGTASPWVNLIDVSFVTP